MTDADKVMNAQHFGIDLADIHIQIRIDRFTWLMQVYHANTFIWKMASYIHQLHGVFMPWHFCDSSAPRSAVINFLTLPFTLRWSRHNILPFETCRCHAHLTLHSRVIHYRLAGISLKVVLLLLRVQKLFSLLITFEIFLKELFLSRELE